MSSFLPQLSSITSAAGSFSTVTSLIAIIVAVLLLFKITAIGILQRRCEIGIMKAVGWTGADVRDQFMIESLILGIAGGIAGILLGLFAIFLLGMVDITIPVSQDLASDPFLSSGLQRHVSLPIAFPVATGIMSFALAVIIGVAAGVLASRRISSISPAEVLKNE
jgi:putative ABC transport system permease protein